MLFVVRVERADVVGWWGYLQGLRVFTSVTLEMFVEGLLVTEVVVGWEVVGDCLGLGVLDPPDVLVGEESHPALVGAVRDTGLGADMTPLVVLPVCEVELVENSLVGAARRCLAS